MFNTIPSDEIIEKTAVALKANGIETFVVATGEEAKQKLLDMLPEKAAVMNMTSVTMDTIGVTDAILNSGKYQPARTKLMDEKTESREKRALGATSDWATGSVHAVTQDGKLIIASYTGSQLPAEAYGSPHVVFIAGAQKIVTDLGEGMKRIYEYVLPLESERANKAYNMTSGSFVSKVLIINSELNPDRIKIILVKEILGF